MRTIADHLFDILENSVNACANKISVTFSFYRSVFLCRVSDNGKGTDLEDITDPFVTSRKTRRVGLGLPLLKSSAEGTGGYLIISQEKEMSGTSLEFVFNMKHIDARPFGDLPAVFVDTLRSWPNIDFKVILLISNNNKKLVLDTVDLKKTLEVNVLQDSAILKYVKELLKKELHKIGINQNFGI